MAGAGGRTTGARSRTAEVGERSHRPRHAASEPDVIDELVAVHHPVVRGELHRQPIDQRGEAHRRGTRDRRT